MTAKVGIGGIWHETNTFSIEVTGRSAFEDYQLATGGDIIDRYEGTGTELGGMIDGAKRHGFILAPTLFAAAVPSGLIDQTVLRDLVDDLVARLHDAGPLDGMLMVVHGAAVADGIDDADGWILGRLRAALGRASPLITVFDCHANLSRSVVDKADMLIGYDTYPHIDMAERGREAAGALARMLRERTRAFFAFRKLPLLTVPQKQATSEPPMVDIMAELHAIERQDAILNGSIAMGFPYADVPHLGASVLVYADEKEAADRAADDLALRIWQVRDQFGPDLMAVDQAVQTAIAASDTPVVLAEAADNVGGGSAGDGTVVLDALLKHGAKDAVIVIADPTAVSAAEAVGADGAFDGLVGGRVDQLHGAPVRVQGRVQLITDGRYRHTGSYMTGYETSMGRTAVIEAGGVKVVLTSLRTMPFDSGQLLSVGIQPEAMRIIVAKSAIAWRAAYGSIAKQSITIDSPGIATSNLSRLPFKKRPRPLYPLEPDDSQFS